MISFISLTLFLVLSLLFNVLYIFTLTNKNFKKSVPPSKIMEENVSSSPPPLEFFSDLSPIFKQAGQKQIPHHHPLQKGGGEDTMMRQNQLWFLIIQYARQEFDPS